MNVGDHDINGGGDNKANCGSDLSDIEVMLVVIMATMTRRRW